jgi:DNA adenine methylase
MLFKNEVIVRLNYYSKSMKKRNPDEDSGAVEATPKPFLRWAGGKRRLTNTLIETFPEAFDPSKHRFFEPFIGGGALSFAAGDPNSELYVSGKMLTINDMNPELINTYKVVRDSVEELIFELKLLSKKVNSKNYYEIRGTIPPGKIKRAARFIYLNKTCYNGLWRVNSKGEFNVPFDKSSTTNLFNEEVLKACSLRLKGATITNMSFQQSVAGAKKGDLVYFDPPYLPLTATASFSSYSKEGFTEADHKNLATTIDTLNRKGVFVLMSNSDTPLTRKIFREHLILRRLLMRRTMSATGHSRHSVYEILGMNYKHLQGSEMGKLEFVSRPKSKRKI